MGERVAFLCLGTMGFPLAGHLARAGYELRVWNRTRARAEAFTSQHPARIAHTPAEAARDAAFVLSCTGDDAALRSIALGAGGALSGLRPGAVFVDHSTVSPGLARELAAQAEERGCFALDAPVSGGESGAQRGELTIMAGGSERGFARAQPVLEVYARKLAFLGPPGCGQLAKLVNQICIAGLLEALAEGLAFAERAGLDVPRVVDVLAKGAAQSWQMDQRAGTMLEGRFDFGFAVDWMRKDLGLALAEARRHGAALPVTALVDQLYAALQTLGHGSSDTSSLIELLRLPARAKTAAAPAR